jgi:hypothetical protein
MLKYETIKKNQFKKAVKVKKKKINQKNKNQI